MDIKEAATKLEILANQLERFQGKIEIHPEYKEDIIATLRDVIEVLRK